jgi:hypothetical protein
MRIALPIALIMPEHEEYRQDAYATLFVATLEIIVENTSSWHGQPLRYPSGLFMLYFSG